MTHPRENVRWLVVATAAASAVLISACGMEQSSPDGTFLEGPNGAGGLQDGLCEEGEVQACRVHVDDENCFVGEQECAGHRRLLIDNQ